MDRSRWLLADGTEARSTLCQHCVPTPTVWHRIGDTQWEHRWWVSLPVRSPQSYPKASFQTTLNPEPKITPYRAATMGQQGWPSSRTSRTEHLRDVIHACEEEGPVSVTTLNWLPADSSTKWKMQINCLDWTRNPRGKVPQWVATLGALASSCLMTVCPAGGSLTRVNSWCPGVSPVPSGVVLTCMPWLSHHCLIPGRRSHQLRLPGQTCAEPETLAWVGQ